MCEHSKVEGNKCGPEVGEVLKVEVDEVPDRALTKEELIEKIAYLEQVNTNCMDVLHEERKSTQDYIKEIEKTYSKLLTNKDLEIAYYKRKFNILKEIITMEGGEENAS